MGKLQSNLYDPENLFEVPKWSAYIDFQDKAGIIHPVVRDTPRYPVTSFHR